MHNCFKDAQRIAKDLRGSFANDPGRLAELRQIEQVAEHNYVALNLLSRLGNLEPSLKISFEFIHHPYFATAAVKRSWWSKQFWYFLFEQFYFVPLALVLHWFFELNPPKIKIKHVLLCNFIRKRIMMYIINIQHRVEVFSWLLHFRKSSVFLVEFV